MGIRDYEEAQEIIKNLVNSRATRHISVATETRIGAMTYDSKSYNWTPSKGWY